MAEKLSYESYHPLHAATNQLLMTWSCWKPSVDSALKGVALPPSYAPLRLSFCSLLFDFQSSASILLSLLAICLFIRLHYDYNTTETSWSIILLYLSREVCLELLSASISATYSATIHLLLRRLILHFLDKDYH
ncbi:uncharacterized protein TrAFT101_001385 [Trichoderma asperellum]|uniref:uncharacterized protein n=1 Tax=Trichoderma asperellum TaxID=101201 RepID=UPI0033324BBE|nr:hypothetical protein TrAFT101_001385 [Trichoderma asperellum]